ncbi:MAG: trypsin-like peptidase domain-containing protein [Lachnospiraceae bacterium]|nr:trypsin-like peptidase domain-containing protein [Lachnospiraceae bacterium]
MEENTQYTGEYGNPVENNDMPLSSEESAVTEDSAPQEVSDVKNDNYSNDSNDSADNNVQYGQGAGMAGVEQNTNPQMRNNYYPGPQENVPQQKSTTQKRSSGGSKTSGGSFGKKMLVSVACAIVFGLVAGVCFQGVRYATDRFMPKAASSRTQLKSTSDMSDKVVDATQGNSTPSASQVGMTDVSGIVEQTMPAIVAITSTTQGANYYDLFGQQYQGRDTTSCGSGFIVGQNDKELLIATNNHVIEGAKTISVQFIDEEVYEATVKGTDSSNDLAVIAVPVSKVKKDTMNKIRIADLGSSDDLKVGEMAIAIGNALGYGQSVTVGYISAKDREISAADSNNAQSSATIKAIQTDAAINPGNSGGALLNMQGQVIGINSAKIAASEVEGVGYAIPISVANPIIEELMNKEILKDDEKGYLGISGQTVTDEVARFNVPNGVYVSEVAKNGAADKAGIKQGDVITALNNMEVRSIESLQEKANSYRKGTEVEITIQRSDAGTYKEQKLKVTLQGSESLKDLDSGSSSDSSQGNDSDRGSQNQNPYGDNGRDDYNDGNGSQRDDDWFGFGDIFGY